MAAVDPFDRETYPQYATDVAPASQQLVQCGSDRALIVLGCITTLQQYGLSKEEALYLTAQCLRIT